VYSAPTSRLRHKRPRVLDSIDQEAQVTGPDTRDVSRGSVAGDPALRNALDDRLHDIRRELFGHARIDLFERSGVFQEYVLRDEREGIARALRSTAPIRGVMKIERGAMIDQPEAPMPQKHVRVARGSIDVHHVSVEPHDP